MTEREVIETIEFIVTKDPVHGFVITTSKNPYLLIGRPTKFEAVCVAFTKYLERLNEIENPELVAAQRAAQKIIDDKNNGVLPNVEITDSNGDPEVK